jgi:hypothetical protein
MQRRGLAREVADPEETEAGGQAEHASAPVFEASELA